MFFAICGIKQIYFFDFCWVLKNITLWKDMLICLGS